MKEKHSGGLLLLLYMAKHPGVQYEQIPYWYKRTILGEIGHMLRKWVCQVLAPNCVTSGMRVFLYRLCGFKIGKGCFIGMKCYLDDLCPDKIIIEDGAVISYGVYFSCHGRKQGHNTVVIKKNAYIGMKVSIIARQNMEIGENAVIGACALVNKSIPAGATAVGIPARIITND